MSEPVQEPTPDEVPEPTPDVTPEEEEAEEGLPVEGDLPDSEPVEGEPATDEPPTPSQEGEAPQAAVSEKEIERDMKRLEKSAGVWRKRIPEIMGEAANDLLPCELCIPIIPGYRWNRPPDPLVVERVREAIGLSDLAGFKPANDARMCEDCDGKGRVLSGSKVEKYATVKCLKCNERGYVEVGTRPVSVPVVDANGGDSSPREELEEREPDIDPWGRTRTDPDFGVLPGFVRA